MKGRYGVIFAVFGFIIFFAMEAQAVDWKLYSTNEEGSLYYDLQSIKQASKDVVEVWTKVVYTEKSVEKYIKKYGSEYKELSFSIALMEYNCSEKKGRLLSGTIYNQDGGSMGQIEDTPSSWDFITPSSVNETLFNIVCGSR